jgi:hypothetical protein
MEIVLAPESASRVRAVLGDAVDLSPPAVPRALARLADEAPDVYSRVLDELSGSDIRLDSERTLHRRHRRAVLRRILFGWGEYDSDAGDRVLAKRRIAAAVPIALAVVMVGVAGIARFVHHAHRGAPAAAVHARVGSVRRAVAKTAPIRQGLAQPTPVWSSLLSGRAAMTATSPGTGLWPAVLRPAPVRPSLPLPPVSALPIPSLPIPSLPGRQAGDGPPPPIVFIRTPPATGTPAQAATGPILAPIVYARTAVNDTAPLAGSRTAPTRGVVGDPGAAATLGGSADPVAAASGAARKLGDRVAGQLLTGVIAAAGVPPIPVVVEGSDGTTWLGHAVAAADGRVHISFATPFGGVVLDPDHSVEGLPGRSVIRRRGAAAAAIGAVAQAAADYTQAVARASQLTVLEGGTQIAPGGAAPGWTYAASRLADALSPQAAGTIETLEVPAGTRCLILITGTP